MAPDIKDGTPSKKTPKLIDAIGPFSSFFANDHHAFLVKKSERLASALHVVTGFIAAEEPIRKKLRVSALDLLLHSTSLEKLGEIGPDAYGNRCAEIAALLGTAQAAGLVSGMNAKLICDEYANLAAFVRDRYGLIRTREPQITDTPPPLTSGDLYKGQKDIASLKTHERTEQKDITKAVMDSRRASILSLLSSRDKISIKDAASVIPGVSEKTIQRELLAMVDAGLLIKEGERRWSTYRKAE